MNCVAIRAIRPRLAIFVASMRNDARLDHKMKPSMQSSGRSSNGPSRKFVAPGQWKGSNYILQDETIPWRNRDGGEPIGMVRDNAKDDRQRLRGRRSRDAERERPALVLAIVAGRES